jgi:hypothetical protein
MQCLETKGSRINTYLITSYFTPPLASMDTNSLNTCISSLLIPSIPLETTGSRINTYLITSYFTPPLASMASLDTNSLNTCISSLLISSISLASHHFLFHSPFGINGQKDYSSQMLIRESFMTNVEWH